MKSLRQLRDYIPRLITHNKTKTTIMKQWVKEKDQLSKEFSFKDFKEAVNFVNKVAQLAEQNNHHPDILLYGYKNVRLTLSTHTEGKVTDKDYKLADQIDNI